MVSHGNAVTETPATRILPNIETNPAANALLKAKPLGDERTMSNGRLERRIAKTVKLEVCPLDGSASKETTLTENVSGQGVRVVLHQKLQPSRETVLFPPPRAWPRTPRSVTAPGLPASRLP